MRIWDVSPERLCRRHLLGEHRELHAVWAVITEAKSGYSRHPETLRWVGKLGALYLRHERLAEEMQSRGYRHKSPLDRRRATGATRQDVFVDPPAEQLRILGQKGCGCKTRPTFWPR